MTALCVGGGTSSPAPGLDPIVDWGISTLTSALITRGYLWLLPFVAYYHSTPFNLSTFCATDPPGQPTFTTAEATALLQLEFGADFDSGAAKFAQLVQYLAWFDLCRCDSGAAPTPGAPQTPPSGTPVTPAPPGGTTPSCGSMSGGPVALVASTFSNVIHLVAIPTGARSIRFQLHNNVAGGGTHAGVQWSIVQYGPASTTPLVSSAPLTASGATTQIDIPIDPRAAVVDVSATPGPTSNSNTVSAEGVVSCQGQPAGDPVPTAPPLNPVNNAQIEAILELVTLIQRQVAPFAYVASTSHGSLTGAGHFSVQGLIGVKVTITDTLPGQPSTEGGDPERILGVGWINWGSVDGSTAPEFLNAVTTLSFPHAAGAYTRLGYSLAAGVEATIVEIRREP